MRRVRVRHYARTKHPNSSHLVLWALFGICVVCSLVAFFVMVISDPDRLQTEDYRLARHRLDMIGDERDPNNEVVIEATPTTNTFLETAR